MTLLRPHEYDPAVAMPMVVPADERGQALVNILSGGEWAAGVIMQVLRRPEQRLSI